jgi:hypothetical protein
MRQIAMIFLLVVAYVANAQTPVINFDFPAPGATDISVTPTIRISVNAPFEIVPTSVCLTETEPAPGEAEIHIFEDDLYLGTQESLDAALTEATRLKGVIISTTEIDLIPARELEFSTEYGINIDGLVVINTQTQVSTTITEVYTDRFTTTLPPYQFKDLLTNDDTYDVVNSCETIWVEFNRVLTSTTTVAGDLVEISDMSGTITSSTLTLSGDGLKIGITPDVCLTTGEL